MLSDVDFEIVLHLLKDGQLDSLMGFNCSSSVSLGENGQKGKKKIYTRCYLDRFCKFESIGQRKWKPDKSIKCFVFVFDLLFDSFLSLSLVT